jgi:hypothetical protein
MSAIRCVGMALLGIMVSLAVTMLACSLDSDHDVKVRGGTTNQIELSEKFCDEQTYPTVAERRACKDQLLAAMKCREGSGD